MKNTIKKEVIKTEYWSRADAFLLPLTGLPKDSKYELNSYLFWRDNSIHDYKLVLSFSYDNLEEFTEYCKKEVFPILDKKGYLIENYDVAGRSIFVLDMSEWAMDIQMFLLGKYSKLSKEAKQKIQKFHTDKSGDIKAYIFGVIYPNTSLPALGGKTAMEYVSDEFDIDLEEMKRIGEIGSIYDKMTETLITDVEELCQTDIKEW